MRIVQVFIKSELIASIRTPTAYSSCQRVYVFASLMSPSCLLSARSAIIRIRPHNVPVVAYVGMTMIEEAEKAEQAPLYEQPIPLNL